MKTFVWIFLVLIQFIILASASTRGKIVTGVGREVLIVNRENSFAFHSGFVTATALRFAFGS